MRAFNALKAGSGRGGGGSSAVAALRTISSSSTNNGAESPSSLASEGAEGLHRPLRLLLFATLAGAAAAILPQSFAPSPQAAVALLRADSPRLRSAGAERAAKIGGGGGSKGAGSLAAVPGAAAALLDAAFREQGGGGTDEEDEAAAAAALKAAVAWAAHPEGAAALREAGAAERAAEAATKRGSRLLGPKEEDARHLCWLLRHQEKR